MDLMSLLAGAPANGPTPQQNAALRGQPDPSVQTGTPTGPYFNPNNGQPSSSPGSPGVSGAIKDLLGALAQALAPKAITQRHQKVDQAVAQGSGASGALGDQF